MAELIKLAKIAGVMQDAGHAYSIYPFACYLDLSNFRLESGLSYFRVLSVCLLFGYFVSAAECYCFDLECLLIRDLTVYLHLPHFLICFDAIESKDGWLI